ncbi:hypothetical protein Verru16b_02613 [Lacunisphaera limnophila]|uniref:Adhesin domain-containing protein n=1 Tax=Lacunisphaera limnophila TaxID=1838286 RepID=A0A1D8AXA7_9BACT|nr:hypothetical protein [Lacunisphaera limnophila]AOS45532.1 hypothetical protein Verru16b_02613 [Lacunisphaera limnophila]
MNTHLFRPAGLVLALSLLATVVSAKVTEKFTQTYPLDANGSIHLENVNGSVEIIAWDKNEVALEAEKTARDQEGLDRMHLKIESSPRRLSIRTEHEKKWKFWETMNAQVHYKLMVPAGATLDRIEVVNAGIRVTGVKGSVRLEAVNGSVEADGLSGPGHFETVNGTVRVSYAAMPTGGGIALETVNGTCKLMLPADAAFDLDTDTVNGRVTCDFPITLESSGKRELRGAVNGGGVRVTLDSVNGGLSVNRGK